METTFAFIACVIFLAFFFDFTNGFHDAANSIATIVTTGVLSPRQAVIWAAFFNLIAFLFFKLSVAHTIGTGLINPDIISPYLIFAALVGAIVWNLITWYYGLPSSSSHALIGGLAGAALAKGGINTLILSGFGKVIAAIFLSPLVGLIVGLTLALILTRLTLRYSEASKNRWFKYSQLISSALLSLTHGGNDAQKTMGIIAVLLYSGSFLGENYYVPYWVIISCSIVISLGTLAGGWRIVHTMGQKITDINPLRGSCVEAGAAAAIFAATDLGIPVSTTQTITGAIVGVGLSGSFWGASWWMINKIFVTWLLTIPAAGFIAAVIMWINKFLLKHPLLS
ncbi:MAG: inorganic phosphate transporter [Proteobacteria bacterium]|nr:inorganic phosphate transporter [Pseudomonadota bacterium]